MSSASDTRQIRVDKDLKAESTPILTTKPLARALSARTAMAQAASTGDSVVVIKASLTLPAEGK